ncbi:GNAT family N-acetyltransferase [Paraburkholderia sp. MMS20-SJTR3]|uniref:GNAT family N-acetyltransferase n=1 Tax=Paraburkholderia sejongensis TaxID=2886946 RepID=A0ABS8K4K2_9BURK|nr:GNAT family N-acetyltransferase [Paraburkholderia sp. MMS20-SJTR3]MCC8396808.1 GNAT family N-acetyltransferase [Paraburkholderia sp. MMS20-SJTR3]
MDWKCREFGQLSSVEIYQILRARNAILVVEDAHMHQDIDGKDETAVHVFAVDTIGGESLVVAYARLRPGDEVDPEAMIDKSLTHPTRRDDDTAERLMERTLAAADERWPHAPVRTHSPAHRETFYKRFGFRKADGPFLQHGMPFIGMIRAGVDTQKSLNNPWRMNRASAERSNEAVAQTAESEHAKRRADGKLGSLSCRLNATPGVSQ